MTISYAKFFQPTVLGLTAATLYTVPVSPTSNLLRGARVRLTNTTTTAASVTLYAVPVGGAAGVSNAFVSGVTVPASGFVDTDVPIMAAGDFLQGLAGTASSITAHAVFGGVFSA